MKVIAIITLILLVVGYFWILLRIFGASDDQILHILHSLVMEEPTQRKDKTED